MEDIAVVSGRARLRLRGLPLSTLLCAPIVSLALISPVKPDVAGDFLRALRRADLARAKAIFLDHQNEASKAFEKGLATHGEEFARRYRHALLLLQPQLRNHALSEIASLDASSLKEIYGYKERGLRDKQNGNWRQAREQFEKALQIARAGDRRWQQQHLLFLIAYTLADEGRFPESNRWLSQCLTLQRSENPTHLDAMVQENLGMNSQKQGDLYPALQHYYHALELHAAIEYREGIAAAANNLATLYHECGNFKAALEYYRQCLRFLPPGHPDVPTVENNIADCLLALHHAEDARVILAKAAPKKSAAYFQRLSLHQQYLRSIGKTNQALALATSSLREAEQTKNPEFISDALCDALRVAPSGAEASRLLAEAAPLLVKDDPNRWQMELLRAQIYYRERNLKRVEESCREAFLHLQRHKLGTDFEFNFSARVLEVARLWTSAFVQQGKIYQGLTVWEMGKSFARGRPHPALHLLQQSLGPDCAVIDFCVTDQRTFVWIIRRETLDCIVLNTPESTLGSHIDSLVAPFGHTVNLLAPLYNRQIANLLYRTVIEPLESDLAGTRCWTILPDGKLHAVPFEILESNSGRPLLEKAAIRYWDTLHVPEGKPRTLESLTAWLDGPVEDLAFLPRGTHVAGTWDEVRQNRSDMLHYAGHSLSNQTFPALSTLATQDVVTARQIAQTRLAYRLIVLSSCDSAGEISGFGNGLLGLSSGFQAAGARQIIATLWPIDQHSTRLLAEFYRLPLREASLAQNFRRARLQFRRNSFQVGVYSVSMSNPYFWAPYILIAPHYPHPPSGGGEWLSFLAVLLATLTTRYCSKDHYQPKV